ncbi:MAG TPA: sensor histidine kinase [Verrucomicrobiae bacterium]|nr:sensor histidine kinase [Verrucomicrobiae bacterium]
MSTQTTEAGDELLPDFCRWQPLVLVAVIMELLAVVLTLAAGVSVDLQQRFILNSLYLQWAGFCSAAVLCLARRRLHAAPVGVVFLGAWVLLVAVATTISVAGYELLLHADAAFAAQPEPRLSFLFRHFFIGAIVSLLVLRLFWLQHQWRQQVLSEGRSRYEALQARIRPHFLFNSLNSIAALVSIRPDDAERLIEDMAELLRAGLDGRSRLVPLSDELALSKAYLRIEQSRLGERLQVKWDIEAGCEALEVPLLSVQPLVENAVYHGIERVAAPGTVEVAARRSADRLHIEVANPRPDAAAPAHQGQRIAVDNIAQRLALIYGDGRARLELGAEGDRFVSRLTLPITQAAA